ncbi:MAG: DUF354 domain-containing protein [Roseivirga sp.]
MAEQKGKFLFQLNHPAHFHLFKHSIDELENRGHEVLITIKEKDILKKLVSGRQFIQISKGKGYRKKNIRSILSSLFQRNKELLKVVREYKPDMMIGTSPEIGQIRYLVKTPAIFFGEDDVNLSPIMYLGALSCYPLFSRIVSPKGVNNSIWNRKTSFYQGYQKLAYLHPNRFTPDRSKVHIAENKKFFLLRFASLAAYHDLNATGINDHIARDLIKILEPHGEVIISAERPLPDDLEPYRFKGNLLDIHHYMYYTQLYIGDSQSMAVEASMLGTPNIRYSDFVGKITVLEDLEHKYGLTKGVHTSDKEGLFTTLNGMLKNENLIKNQREKRARLLKEKIDVTGFMLWFFENYPESVKTLKTNPEIEKRFISGN